MIKQLRVLNFKSFIDETIDFGSFSLIYGSNGVGKSNLTDALRLLRAIGEGRSVRDAIEGHASVAGGPTSTVTAGVRGGARNIPNFNSGSRIFGLEVMVDTDRGPVNYIVHIDADEYKVVREEMTPARLRTYIYSTHPESAPLKQSQDSPAILARYYKNSPGRNPSRSFSSHEFILTQFVGRKAETAGNERWANQVREALAGIAPLELRPESLRQYSPLGRFEMGEHGENFAASAWRLLMGAELPDRDRDPTIMAARSDVMEELLVEDPDAGGRGSVANSRGRLAAICSWLAQLTPRQIGGVAVEYAPTNEVIFSLFEEPYDRPLNARILSDGTLRISALAFALLGDNSQRTFVIEEIENGINPSRVHLLLQLLESATGGGSGKQVIATTHAPALLDVIDSRLRKATLVVGWDAELATSVVTPLAKLPGLSEAEGTASLSELLTEGWIQLAADR